MIGITRSKGYACANGKAGAIRPNALRQGKGRLYDEPGEMSNRGGRSGDWESFSDQQSSSFAVGLRLGLE
jgi:hypothetical protein